MILVVGGTKEAKEVARILIDVTKAQGECADLKTTYGESVSSGVVFLPRSLNCPMTVHLIRKYKIKTVVDAAPVYFKGASVKTMSACKMTKARYIRFEPPVASLKGGRNIYAVKNIKEACAKAMAFGETIFLNIGNNNVNVFVKEAIPAKKKIVVRVSETGVLKNFLKSGIERHNILLIDGVFSEAFNRGLIREYNVSVFVTRELGKGNGTEHELSAAFAEGIPVVIIERPALNCPQIVTDYNKLADEVV